MSKISELRKQAGEYDQVLVCADDLTGVLDLVEAGRLPLQVYVDRCKHDDAAGECSDHVCILARRALALYDAFDKGESDER